MSFKSNLSSETETNIKIPKMYCIIMHNDDYTPQDFVVNILIKIFHKQLLEANNLMMKIHETGKSIVGTYTYDIAVTKKISTEQMASSYNFPLKVTIDEAIE